MEKAENAYELRKSGLALKLGAPFALRRARFGLERLLRLADLRQPLFATHKLLGQLIAATVGTEALVLLGVD